MSSRGRDKTGGNLEPMPFVRKFGAAAAAEASATSDAQVIQSLTELSGTICPTADFAVEMLPSNSYSDSRSPRRDKDYRDSKRRRSRSNDRRRSHSRDKRRSSSRGRRRSSSRDRRSSVSKDKLRSSSRDRRHSGSRDRRRSSSRDRRRSSRPRSRSRSKDRRSSRRRRERTPTPPAAVSEVQEGIDAGSVLAKIKPSAGVLPLLARPDIMDTLAARSSSPLSDNGDGVKADKRARKSRWSSTKSFVPGMPTILPSNLSDDQRQAYLLQLEVEDATRKLRLGDFMGNPDPALRSPSPEPIYDASGKRLNTREVRKRQELEQQRHEKIQALLKLNPNFKPPADYRPPTIRLHDKVWIPQENHPEINFVGLLIGPRGNTLKSLEAETGAKIIIRGKGSVKEGKLGHREGPMPGENEPLHAYVTATDSASIKKACDKITSIINEALMIPDGQNELRKLQLRELALLNGTLRPENLISGTRCSNCGSDEHKTWECPDAPNVTASIICTACGAAGHIAKDCKNPRPGTLGTAVDGSMDDEYSALMVELGEKPAMQQVPQVKLPLANATNGGQATAFKSHTYTVPTGAPIVRIDLTKPQPQPQPFMGGFSQSLGAFPSAIKAPILPTSSAQSTMQAEYFPRLQTPITRPTAPYATPSTVGWGSTTSQRSPWGAVPPPSTNRFSMSVRPTIPATGLGFMPPPPPPPAPVPKPDFSSLLAPAPPPPPPQ